MNDRPMAPLEREVSDRDPAIVRKTTLPCAIEDGDEPPTTWSRLRAFFRRSRRESVPAELPLIEPPLAPESLPEPPEPPDDQD